MSNSAYSVESTRSAAAEGYAASRALIKAYDAVPPALLGETPYTLSVRAGDHGWTGPVRVTDRELGPMLIALRDDEIVTELSVNDGVVWKSEPVTTVTVRLRTPAAKPYVEEVVRVGLRALSSKTEILSVEVTRDADV